MGIDREKILSTAQRFVLKGQSEKAIKEYQKLINASPKDIRSHLKLGDLYLKNGENEKALTEYMKVAELYMEEDLGSRAISVYKRVLSLDPKRIEALHYIAKLYLKQGLKGDARNYYQNILKLRPDDEDALRALKEYEDRSRLGEAPNRLTSPSLSSKNSPALEQRSTNEIHLPLPVSTVRSVPSYDGGTTSADKDAEMHYHLGIAYKEMELYDYAISEFELAASNGSVQFDCYIMLGACFMEKGDIDKSIEYYRTASELKGLTDKELARLYFNLGCAYEANGMFREALDAFTRVLQVDRSLSEVQEKIDKLRKQDEQ